MAAGGSAPGAGSATGAGAAGASREGLARRAGAWHVWALGTGAALSGHYFGWNFGLAAGGLGGMLLAGALVVAMYWGLCLAMAGMSAALPHAGGGWAFARAGMGPWAGLAAGVAQTLPCLIFPALIVVGMGEYAGTVAGTPGTRDPLLWVLLYGAFVGVNALGTGAALRACLVLTAVSLAVLAVFCAVALPQFSWEHALAVEPLAGHGAWLPRGGAGVLMALPYAMWFLLALELVPTVAEDCRDPARDMPRGILRALLTLAVSAAAVLVLVTGAAPGARELGAYDAPLLRGAGAVLGEVAGPRLLALAMLAGLAASFQAILFAGSRNLFALARAGYLPAWLAVLHPRRRTPQRALLVTALLGLPVAAAFRFSSFLFGDLAVSTMLVGTAAFGALVCCAMQCVAFLVLRGKRPGMMRPYRSAGPGAWAALLIAGALLYALALSPLYRGGIVGVLGCIGIACVCFPFAGGHRRAVTHRRGPGRVP